VRTPEYFTRLHLSSASTTRTCLPYRAPSSNYATVEAEQHVLPARYAFASSLRTHFTWLAEVASSIQTCCLQPEVGARGGGSLHAGSMCVSSCQQVSFFWCRLGCAHRTRYLFHLNIIFGWWALDLTLRHCSRLCWYLEKRRATYYCHYQQPGSSEQRRDACQRTLPHLRLLTGGWRRFIPVNVSVGRQWVDCPRFGETYFPRWRRARRHGRATMLTAPTI